MTYREAHLSDVKEVFRVRLAVKENPLPDPGFITEKEYERYLTQYGKGWVCEADGKIVGFCIVGLTQRNIWALFVQPEYEGRGIGKRLHDMMLDWYFDQTRDTVWLGTGPDTRAEGFYRKAGWRETGRRPNGEIKFEMTCEEWKNSKVNKAVT